jgi:hypothetical protein
MRNEQDRKNSSGANEQQESEHKKLDDLFHDNSTNENEPTPEEEAQAEQQRKEALTERD